MAGTDTDEVGVGETTDEGTPGIVDTGPTGDVAPPAPVFGGVGGNAAAPPAFGSIDAVPAG
jgi:hypothetical protein